MAGAPATVWFSGKPTWYYAPNTGTAAAIPAATIQWGTAWGGTYVNGGLTQGFPTFQPTFDNRDLETDQDDEAIHAWRIANGLTFKIPMLDTTVANLKRAYGQGTVTTDAASTKIGVGGDTPIVDFYTIGLEGYGPGGAAATPLYRRLWIPKATPVSWSELGFNRKQEQVLEVTFKAYIDTDQAVGKRLWWIDDDLV